MTVDESPDQGPSLMHERALKAGWHDLVVAALLAVFCCVIFNLNMRAISAADNYAARYLPFSILRNHTVVLDPILDAVAQGRQAPPEWGTKGTAFWIRHGLGSHHVSTYPVLLPVVITPLYMPAVAYLDKQGWDPHIFDRVARIMEKLVASLIAATSAALIYLLLRRRCGPRMAAGLSVVYALGTTTWAISSQALWSHGLAQLLIAATMLLLTGQRTVPRAAMAGLLCAAIAANRPPDSILAIGLGMYGLLWAGRSRLVFVAAGLIPIGLTVAYNLHLVGHLAGGYALIVPGDKYNDDILDGVLGLLFSPVRGLLVYSPFLIFLLYFFPLTLRDKSTRALTLSIVAAVGVQVLVYASVDWRQGISYGPRWLGDALPMLMWMLPPVVASLSHHGRALFTAACMASVAIQAVGVFWYVGTVDAKLVQEQGPDRMQGMWRPLNAAFIAELRHPPAPADLLRSVRGNIDLIQVVDVVVDEGAQGQRIERQVDVAGWALVDSRSPVDVSLFVDGHLVSGTGAFFTRPDVVRTLGENSPSGWRARFPAGRLSVGSHSLAALVRTDAGAEPRLLRQRSFDVPAPVPGDGRDTFLDRSAQLAQQRVAERQQRPGYWLTTFTSGPSHEKPQGEMNTYLNAVMLDVMGPVTSTPALAQALTRARTFLSSQIESDGLVRYHGRPDAPTIGTLGCAITPDSDDTALVWRVAPDADRARLASAMKVIQRFRRTDGLYQTWLAERRQYECLDPGRDPNPADIVIQMHILMLLAREAPAEADRLCQALASRTTDDSLWVYYAVAPTMAILRLADMERAGCPLHFPQRRLRSDLPGQNSWIQAVQLLTQLQRAPATAQLQAETANLLQELAAGNFTRITRAPPLLYHNDLTATVRRYYWSEDMGYALWLRLHHEYQRIGREAGCHAQGATASCTSR